jgi:hypothetical protein
LEAIFKQFDVATTAAATLLVFDFVLYYKGLLLEVNGFLERGGNGVMVGRGFSNETLVTLDNRCRRLLYFPLADIRECL